MIKAIVTKSIFVNVSKFMYLIERILFHVRIFRRKMNETDTEIFVCNLIGIGTFIEIRMPEI